jgi:hypothetical protein
MGGPFKAVLRHHAEGTDKRRPAIGGKALLSIHPWSSKARSQVRLLVYMGSLAVDIAYQEHNAIPYTEMCRHSSPAYWLLADRRA